MNINKEHAKTLLEEYLSIVFEDCQVHKDNEDNSNESHSDYHEHVDSGEFNDEHIDYMQHHDC